MNACELIETLFIEGAGIMYNWSEDAEVSNLHKLIAEVSKDFVIQTYSYTRNLENFSYLLKIRVGKTMVELSCAISVRDNRIARLCQIRFNKAKRRVARYISTLCDNEIYHCLRGNTALDERLDSFIINSANFVCDNTAPYGYVSKVTGERLMYDPVLREVAL